MRELTVSPAQETTKDTSTMGFPPALRGRVRVGGDASTGVESVSYTDSAAALPLPNTASSIASAISRSPMIVTLAPIFCR